MPKRLSGKGTTLRLVSCSLAGVYLHLNILVFTLVFHYYHRPIEFYIGSQIEQVGWISVQKTGATIVGFSQRISLAPTSASFAMINFHHSTRESRSTAGCVDPICSHTSIRPNPSPPSQSVSFPIHSLRLNMSTAALHYFCLPPVLLPQVYHRTKPQHRICASNCVVTGPARHLTVSST